MLENTSLNLSNEVVLVIALTLCQFGIYDGVPLLSPRLQRNLSAVCKLGELNVYLLMYLIIAR